MKMMKQEKMPLKTADLELKVSYRQEKRRIYAAYLSGGDRPLVHGNVGKPSNQRLMAELKEQAIKRYQERYSDFRPAFAAGIPESAGSGACFGEHILVEDMPITKKDQSTLTPHGRGHFYCVLISYFDIP
jgi:hypothetical protein